MTGENSRVRMERDNPSNDRPVCKSVATNCVSDFPHLLTSSSSSSSSTVAGSSDACCLSSETLPTSETDMFRSAVADEVRIFRDAKNRLESFKMYNWPKENVETRDLAEAGFFLPKVRQLPDEVECIFCRVKVGNWSPAVDPFAEHLKHSPRCDFMSGYIVQNIPLGGTPASDPIRGSNKRTPNLDVCGSCPPADTRSDRSPSSPLFPAPFSSNFASAGASSSSSSSHDVTQHSAPRPSESVSIHSSDPSSSIISDQQLIHRPPRHTNFVTAASRLNTYPSDWCQLCPISASSLAEAGFFYSGPVKSDHLEPSILHDVVTCFHCDRKVFNWSVSDDPWQEHYRLNKGCYFIELNYNPSRKSVQSVSTSTTSTGVPCQPCILPSRPAEEVSQSPLEDISPLSQELNVISSQVSNKQAEKSTTGSSDESNALCKVCYTNEVELLFLPCKHASCCGQCAASVTTCPLCRTRITGSIRIFLS